MQILVDTGVALDVQLRREPWLTDAAAIWEAMEEQLVTGWLTASSLTDIFYLVRRAVDIAAAQAAVRLCLKTFAICTVDRAALEDALALPGADFEDNLQIACAVLAQLDGIVTRNAKGFRDASLAIFTPAELRAKLGSSEE